MLRDIESERLYPPGARLLLAVSGGCDSICLLVVCRALASSARRGETIAVAHLNHRLRGLASDRDALFVAATARGHGLPCLLGEAESTLGAGGNREARARSARGAFLARAAHAWGAHAVCLGHTRDDQAETVLLRLARGAGPGALAAMAPRRRDDVVRPLLGRGRAQCRDYLRACGAIAVEDASNADPRHARNRVRAAVLPALEEHLGPGVAQGLAGVEDGAALPVARVVEAGEAGARLVHAWLARAGVCASARQVAALVSIARGGRPSGTVDLSRTVRVARCYGELRIEPHAGRGAAVDAGDGSVPWDGRALDLPGPGGVLEVAGWRLAVLSDTGEPRSGAGAGPLRTACEIELQLPESRLPLRVRRARPGDRIRLFGGRRKLSDVLVDARVPRRERDGLVVLTTLDDMIVWVPGIARAVLRESTTGGGLGLVVQAQRLDCRPGGTVVGKQRIIPGESCRDRG